MKTKSLLVAVATCAALGACAPQTRFEWGNYEDSLYAYYKDPAARESYRKALIAAIDKGKRANQVAPGLLAELGYLDLEDGDTNDALPLFREEMLRFPESRPFLTGIVERAEGAQKKSGATS
jgi:hypothetical protein